MIREFYLNKSILKIISLNISLIKVKIKLQLKFEFRHFSFFYKRKIQTGKFVKIGKTREITVNLIFDSNLSILDPAIKLNTRLPSVFQEHTKVRPTKQERTISRLNWLDSSKIRSTTHLIYTSFFTIAKFSQFIECLHFRILPYSLQIKTFL